MLKNLTEVFMTQGSVVQEQIPYEADSFTCGNETYPIVSKAPCRMTFSNIGTSKALIEGKTEITFQMFCSRCLKPVEETINLDFSREVFSPDAVNAENDEDIEDFMEGYECNIENLINNEIIINMPMKVLCKPDCKGICKQCGADLNEGECGCDTFVPDPRMAAIKDIFNANKEV